MLAACSLRLWRWPHHAFDVRAALFRYFFVMIFRISSVVWVAVALFSSLCQASGLRSEHAIVISDETGQVLMEKNADTRVPIASLTKLMTAMVVLDAHPDMNETIVIQASDVDQLKHSTSHVPVGTVLSRQQVLELALMCSDNRAAAALARTYPGGNAAFLRGVQLKIAALGLHNTVLREPTGLSPENQSSAADLARMAQAAGGYPQIVHITTDHSDQIRMNGRAYTLHNTNHLVGAAGWNVLLSKTGFTNEAGHCLIMRISEAKEHVTLVLLHAGASSSRFLDATQIRNYLSTHHSTGATGQLALLR